MPGPRLLIVADPKMSPALANGLREGNFEIATAPIADLAAAQAAGRNADALAIFYGAQGAPLAAALQALAPSIRERGGRAVAVLQRDQAAQRDDCFRAGASDVLFMPQPKEQFVARLRASVALSWEPAPGTTGPISVATRTASSKVEQASISSAGIESPGELPLKPGETVRLQWSGIVAWGLVVRGAPSTQIRFAGLTADEEAKIRDFIKKAAEPRAAATQPAPAAPLAAAAAPAVAARSAPAAGPPPGFAERPAQRPNARPAPLGPSAAAAPPPPPAGPALVPPAPPARAPSAANAPRDGDGAGLSNLFADSDAPAAPAAPAAPSAAAHSWPSAIPVASCKSAAMQLLSEQSVAADVPAGIAASARKIAAMLGASERAAIEQAGPESHFADALAARIALDAATAEGVKLYSGATAIMVDTGSVAALTRTADEAAARLQKEANAAIGRGEVENLQLVTAASAALSRDLLNFKETADRLRGLGAAPRLGAGALDPDVVLPGQQQRPKPAAGAQPAQARAELRDFRALEQKPGRAKPIIAAIVLAGGIVLGINALYFAMPRHGEIPVEAAGKGVQRIDVSGTSALVTVTPEWTEGSEAEVRKLAAVLRDRGVTRAILKLPSGTSAGILDVATGKLSGVPRAKPPAPADTAQPPPAEGPK